MSATGVWVARATVGGMARNHIHSCTFFDDGDHELLCTCGTRGLYLVDDDAPDGVLVVLLDDVDLPVDVTLVAPRELAVSA